MSWWLIPPTLQRAAVCKLPKHTAGSIVGRDGRDTLTAAAWHCCYHGVPRPTNGDARVRAPLIASLESSISIASLEPKGATPHHHSHEPNDAIFALASAAGRAAIAIIRLSGPGAGAVLRGLTGSRQLPPPHMLLPRRFMDPSTGQLLDMGMCVYLPGPKTSTGEDVVELHIHGGRAVVASVLRALGSLARPASPGEFTRRAFAHGKLDLTQVEALADLLNADTDAQRKQALVSLDGALSRLYDSWREELLGCLAHCEAVIDFSEDQDDIGDEVYSAIESRVATLLAAMQRHLNDGGRGEVLRRGVWVVLTGPVNAGKSSLLNALSRTPAAIVSHLPGTTRDVIEVAVDLGGVPTILVDTAGLRDTPSDEVEAEGMRRARERARTADVRLCVLDASLWPRCAPASVLDSVAADTIVVLNKCDLAGSEASVAAAREHLARTARAVLCVSCVTGGGIQDVVALLTSCVAERVWGGPAPRSSSSAGGPGVSSGGLDADIGSREEVLVSRARHRHHLERCAAAMQAFLARPHTIDMAAEELRMAVRELACIVGRVDVEQLLDVIFRDFCIGK